MYACTPPGYDADVNAVYPVLYLLHGGADGEPFTLARVGTECKLKVQTS